MKKNTSETVFETSADGAVRESINTKIDTTLVPYELTVAAAVGLNYGEQKYSARNFEQGFELYQLTGSIERHNKAIQDGEYYDRDSGIPHFMLLASSIAMLCHNMMQHRIVPSNRPPKTGRDIAEIACQAQMVAEEAAATRDMVDPKPGVARTRNGR